MTELTEHGVLKIDVTQDDIAHGEPGIQEDCAFSLAFLRALREWSALVRPDGSFLKVYTKRSYVTIANYVIKTEGVTLPDRYRQAKHFHLAPDELYVAFFTLRLTPEIDAFINSFDGARLDYTKRSKIKPSSFALPMDPNAFSTPT